MASEYTRRITLDFDYSSVQKGVPTVAKQMQVLNSEFASANEAAKAMGDTEAQLALKSDQLSKQIEILTGKLAEEKQRLEEAKNVGNEQAIENYSVKVAQTTSKIEQLNVRLAENNKKLEEHAGESKAAEKQIEALTKAFGVSAGTAQKINKIFEEQTKKVKDLKDRQKELETAKRSLAQQVDVNREKLRQANEQYGRGSEQSKQYKEALDRSVVSLSNVSDELRKTNKELDSQHVMLGKTKDQWNGIGDKFISVGSTMTKAVTLPVLAAGAGAVKMAADYEQSIGKAEVVFGQNMVTINRWAQNSLAAFGLSKKSAIEMVGDYGAMWNAMGVAQDKALQNSMAMTERVRDLSAFFNTTTEETKTALNSILTGSVEPLRKFGVVMNQSQLELHAMTMGLGRHWDKLNEAQKVQVRYNFVMEKTKQAVGQYKREQNNLSTQTETFSEVIKELSVNFGQGLLPLITPLVKGISDFFKRIAGLDEGTRKFITTMLMVIATIGPLLLLVGKVITIGSSLTTLMSTTGGFGFLKWIAIILAVVAALSLLATIIAVITGKGGELNRTFSNMRGIPSQPSGGVGRHFDVGTNFINRDQIATVHRGEAIIPAESNPWNPNARTPYGAGGGDTFNLNVSMDEVGELYKLVQVVNGLKQSRRARG